MNPKVEGHDARLAHLAALRERFAIRADLLPADLALAGLLDDMLDASSAAIEFAERSTRAVYPLVRTAFEAAQRIVVLATDDEYLRVGTRAWLYYQRKDASVLRRTRPEEAERWLEAVVSQMRNIWVPHNEQAEVLLADEAARLDEKGRKPDNFMGKDLAAVVQDRYERVFGPAGLNSEVIELNRGTYAALSRESHARLRIEAAALTIRQDGTVRVIPRRIDEPSRRRTLLDCLGTSLAEAAGAVSYLLGARDRADAEAFRVRSSQLNPDGLPHGFSPDLGVLLARGGAATTTFHFLSVPIWKLGVLPDGTVWWSANLSLGAREYAATFVVPADLRRDFARTIGVSPGSLEPSREIVKHDLSGLTRIGVKCTLGKQQRNAKETYVPLVVKAVVAEGAS